MIQLISGFLERGAKASEVKEYYIDGEHYVVSFFRGKDAVQVKDNMATLEKTQELARALGL